MKTSDIFERSYIHRFFKQNAEILPLLGCITGISIATQLFKVYLPLWMYKQTGEAVYLGAVRVLEYLPMVIFFYAIGLFIDKHSSRTVTMVASICSAVVATITFAAGMQRLYWVLLGAFAFYISFYILSVSKVVITKRCCSENSLGKANILVNTTSQTLVISGGAIGGLGILLGRYIDPPKLIVLFSVFSFFCALYLKERNIGEIGERSDNVTLRLIIKEWVKNKPVFLITLLTSIYNFIDAVLWFTFLYILKVQLSLGDEGVAIVMSFSAIGCWIGFFISKVITTEAYRGFLVANVLMLMSLTAMVVASNTIYLIALVAFLLSLSNILYSVSLSIFRQHSIPDAIAGRMNAWLTVITRLGAVVAFSVAPFAYERISATYCINVLVMPCIMLCWYSLKLYRSEAVTSFA